MKKSVFSTLLLLSLISPFAVLSQEVHFGLHNLART